jgi:hypothetical protein
VWLIVLVNLSDKYFLAVYSDSRGTQQGRARPAAAGRVDDMEES